MHVSLKHHPLLHPTLWHSRSLNVVNNFSVGNFPISATVSKLIWAPNSHMEKQCFLDLPHQEVQPSAPRFCMHNAHNGRNDEQEVSFPISRLFQELSRYQIFDSVDYDHIYRYLINSPCTALSSVKKKA